jgi:peptidoglycan/LPS O-acetylase OafA/YrhL
LVVLATVATASHEAALLALVQPRYAMYFVVGIALGLIRRFGADLLLAGVAGMAWLLSTYWLTVGLDAWPPEAGGRPGWVPAIGLSAISTGAVLAVSYLPSRAWSSWLVPAGRLAYPLFLVHGAVAWLVVRAVGGRLPALPVFAMALVASVACAAVLHLAVEVPAGPRLRGLVLGATTRIRAQSEADRGRPARAPKAINQPIEASAVVAAEPGPGQWRVPGPGSAGVDADRVDVDGNRTHV